MIRGRASGSVRCTVGEGVHLATGSARRCTDARSRFDLANARATRASDARAAVDARVHPGVHPRTSPCKGECTVHGEDVGVIEVRSCWQCWSTVNRFAGWVPRPVEWFAQARAIGTASLIEGT
jgi:hypothetical protein